MLLVGDETDQLGPGVQSELLCEMRAVGFYGSQSDPQGIRRFGVGVTEGEQLEHLLLPGGEREQRVAAVATGNLVPSSQLGAQRRLHVPSPAATWCTALSSSLGSADFNTYPSAPEVRARWT